MTKAEIKMRTNLIELLQKLDAPLLQRVSDFTQGLLAASDESKKDWWDELPDSVKEGYYEGMKDIEEGNLISIEEFMKKRRSSEK